MIMIETGRLVLRQWREEDVAPFAEMNRDVTVMEHMPKCLSREESEQLYRRIMAEHEACMRLH